MREICFDTETTGLDPKTGDRVTEIGCVEIVDRKLTGKTYREIINPGRKNSLESIEITGLTDEILKDKPFFSEIVDGLLEFMGDSQLVAHNASFDMMFLNHELSLLEREPLKNTVVDSLVLAKTKFPGKKNNLDILCERFSIDNSRREKHGALLDAELLAEVYLCLTQEAQTQFFSDLEKAQQTIAIEVLIETINKKERLEKRTFNISIDEEVLHKTFLEKNIKGSIWE